MYYLTKSKPLSFAAIPGGEGEQIIVRNVTRYCDYYYECKASNGVEPDDLRRMKVTVECK